MNKAVIAAVWLGLGVLSCVGCGSASPSPVTPTVVDVSGAWVGEQTLGSFTDGECLAPVFQSLLGLPSQFHATLTQAGNLVTATIDIDHTGGVCTYSGAIDGTTLALTATTCTGTRTLGLSCPSGELRDLLPVSESLLGTVGGGVVTGTAVENDVLFAAGTPNRVGGLVGLSTFRLSRP